MLLYSVMVGCCIEPDMPEGGITTAKSEKRKFIIVLIVGKVLTNTQRITQIGANPRYNQSSGRFLKMSAPVEWDLHIYFILYF